MCVGGGGGGGEGIVRERCSVEHRRQKSFYEEKVHGKSYNLGVAAFNNSATR